jgi:phosphoribosylaminoimidazole-succinocarboxamide synthase
MGNVKEKGGMETGEAVMEINLHEICNEVELVSKGKVREIYRLKQDPSKLLLVATDRLSAFDVVMKNGIPDKGKILTQLSAFWFRNFAEKELQNIPHHLITTDLKEMPIYLQKYSSILSGRSMLVHSLKMLPVEAVVRGYLTGSAWKEYSMHQTVHGKPLSNLSESCRFEHPLYTPTTKAPLGQHGKIQIFVILFFLFIRNIYNVYSLCLCVIIRC